MAKLKILEIQISVRTTIRNLVSRNWKFLLVSYLKTEIVRLYIEMSYLKHGLSHSEIEISRLYVGRNKKRHFQNLISAIS